MSAVEGTVHIGPWVGNVVSIIPTRTGLQLKAVGPAPAELVIGCAELHTADGEITMISAGVYDVPPEPAGAGLSAEITWNMEINTVSLPGLADVSARP